MNKYVTSIVISAVTLSLAGSIFAAITPPPVQFPTNKEQCKNDGWQDFNGMFKNQGDCVSFVVTDGQNKPSGN